MVPGTFAETIRRQIAGVVDATKSKGGDRRPPPNLQSEI